eukprot:545414-Amphidinium_carterae.1
MESCESVRMPVISIRVLAPVLSGVPGSFAKGSRDHCFAATAYTDGPIVIVPDANGTGLYPLIGAVDSEGFAEAAENGDCSRLERHKVVDADVDTKRKSAIADSRRTSVSFLSKPGSHWLKASVHEVSASRPSFTRFRRPFST